ncbi:hypothetical protein [Nostoc flagelliforme]
MKSPCPYGDIATAQPGAVYGQGKRISNPIDTVVLGFNQSTKKFKITTLSQGVGLTFSSLCG